MYIHIYDHRDRGNNFFIYLKSCEMTNPLLFISLYFDAHGMRGFFISLYFVCVSSFDFKPL